MKTDQNNNMQGTLTKRRNMKKRKNAKRVLLALNLVAVIFTTTVFSNPVSVLSEEVSTDAVQNIENNAGGDAQIAEQADVQQNTAEAAPAAEAPAAEAPAAENSAEAAKAEEPSGVNAPAENAMSAEMSAAEDGAVSTDDGASSASAVQSADVSSASNESFEDAGAGNTDGTKDGIIENDAEGLNDAEGTAANGEAEDAASQEQLTYADEHVKISASYTDGRAFTADSILTGTYLDSDEKNAVLSAVNTQISKDNSANTVSDPAENAESSDSAAAASTTTTTVEYSAAGLHALILAAKNKDGSDATTEGDITFSSEFKNGLNDAGYSTREENTENNEATEDGSLTTTTTRCETSWKIYAVTEKNLTDITDITDAHNTHYEMDENGTLKSASFRGALPQTVAFVQIVKKTVTETTTQKETEKATEKETQKVTEKYTEKITGKAAEKTTETETEKEDVKAEVPASAAMPAVAFDQKVTTENGTVMVHIDAEEGAFEEGTSMTVTPVTRHDILDKAIDAAGGKGAAAAMDITFTKADGTKTEPLKPIHVKMISPVLNHAEEAHVVHVADSGTIDVVARKSDGKTIESTSSEAASSDAKNAVSFESDSFSVYAIVYTVDFHWEVDGQMYEFSLPGGGFISFSDLIEVLGVAKTGENDDVYLPGEVPGIDNQDANGENNTQESAESADNTGYSGVHNPMEVPGINDQDATGENGSAALTLDGVVVSEKTREFVADVKSVVFSSPELVDVSKVESETTVGGIKESRGLDVQYSAELTEEQIAEINAQTVVAGDWALISVQPFESTESLTVTMKTGEVFEIRVTDAQLKKTVKTASGETWEITITYDDSAEIPKDAELRVEEILPEDERYEQYYQQSLEKISVGEVPDTIEDESGSEMIDETAETASEEAATTTSYAHIFDIQIWAGDQQIEPASGSTVSVSIKLLDAPENEDTNLQVVHFGKDGLEVMELAENNDETKAGGTELNFVTDEFSVYAIIGTETFTEKFLTEDGETYNISVTAGAEAHIPADAHLEISEVKEGSDKYDELFAKAQAAVTDGKDASVPFARFFDIAIVKDGEKIQPDAPVDVKISFDETVEANKNAVFNAVHIADDGENVDVLDVETEGEESDEAVTVNAVQFEAEGFSIYGVTYTVDFETVDGGVYSVPGEGSYKLNDLLTYIIGKEGKVSDATLELVEGEDVEGALYLTQDGEKDWYINSDVAFTSTYELTMVVDGVKYVVKVTDEATSDLTSLLTTVTVTGAVDQGDGTYMVESGKNYSVHLQFEENDTTTFNRHGTLTYQLPNGIIIPSQKTGTIVPSDSHLADIYTINYVVNTNGLVTFTWNVKEGKQSEFEALTGGVIGFDLTAQFDENATSINWHGKGTYKLDKTKDIAVNKEAWFDNNDGKMHYRIIATSKGNNSNVELVDTFISGAAVTLDQDSIHETSSPAHGISYSNKSGSGFTAKISSMTNGDKVTIEYTATVDYDKLIQKEGKTNSHGSISTTGNTVEYTGNDDNPGNDTKEAHVDNQISYSSASKSVSGGVYENGKRTMNWQITANNEHKTTITYITDTMKNGSDKMEYSGDGITVQVFDANGEAVGSYTRTWGELGVSSSSKSWRHDIPGEYRGQGYSYIVNYKTAVDVGDSTSNIGVSNEVETDYGKGTGSGDAEPRPGQKHDFNKTVNKTDIPNGTVTWDITIDVPETGLDECVVTDYLPRIEGNAGTFFDTYKSFTVDGLIDGEVVTPTTTTTTRTIDGEDVEFTDSVVFTFTKGEEPGLYPVEGGRQVVLHVVTGLDPDWLAVDASNDSSLSSYLTHTNKARHNNVDKTASINIDTAEPKAIKTEQSKFPSTFHWKGQYGGANDLDGWGYQVYFYGLSDETIEGDTFTFTDTYDDRYLMFEQDYYEQWAAAQDHGSNFATNNGNIQKFHRVVRYYVQSENRWYESDQKVNASVSGDTITFSIPKSDLPKDEQGNYYSQYSVGYVLHVKDKATVEQMKEDAKAAGGVLKMRNTAFWAGTEPTSVDVTYEVPIISKSHTDLPGEGNYQFELKINENADRLGDSEFLTVTDTVTNLTVDYKTISFTPEDAVVSYNHSGNTMTFIVRNQTAVTITYNSSALVTGQFSNVLEMNGETKIDSGEANVDARGTSSFDTPLHIHILKHVEGNMMDVLPDVTFQIYKYSETAENHYGDLQGTYTTLADGMFEVTVPHIQGNRNLSDKYVIHEVEPPEGFQRMAHDYTFTISKETANYGQYIYIDNDTLPIANKPVEEEELEISVVKTWSGTATNEELPDVTIHLWAKDEKLADKSTAVEVESYTLSAADLDTETGKWTHKFEHLDATKTYFITEDPIPGYIATYTSANTLGLDRSGEIGVTNTKQSLHVEKVWSGGNAPDSIRGLNINVLKDGAFFKSYTIYPDTETGKWELDIDDLIFPGEYTVEEQAVSGWTLKSTVYTQGGNTVTKLTGTGTATITNQPDTTPQEESLKVEKKWYSDNGTTELTDDEKRELTSTVELVRYREELNGTQVHFMIFGASSELASVFVKKNSDVTINIDSISGANNAKFIDHNPSGYTYYYQIQSDQSIKAETWFQNGLTSIEFTSGNRSDIYVVFAGDINLSVSVPAASQPEGGFGNATVDPDYTNPDVATLNYANIWTASFMNLPTTGTGSDGKKYSYTYGLREKSASGGFELVGYTSGGNPVQMSTEEGNENATVDLTKGSVVTVSNKVKTTDVEITKQWEGLDNVTVYTQESNEPILQNKLSVTAELERYYPDGTKDESFDGSSYIVTMHGYTGDASQNPYETTDSTSSAYTNEWSAKWKDLPGAGKNSSGEYVEYTYKVKETKVSLDSSVNASDIFAVASGYNGDVTNLFTSTIGTDGKTVINTFSPTSIRVDKKWKDGEDTNWPEDVESVTVQLFAQKQGGEKVAIKKDSSTFWTLDITKTSRQADRTFTNLPAKDNAGNDITYSVEEIKITKADGTVIEVSNGKAGDWIVTNDDVSNGEVGITNEKVQNGSLKLKKEVKVNDTSPTDANKALTNGAYNFAIQGIAETATAGISHTVEITFADGIATSYKLDGGDPVTITSGENPWIVEVPNLTAGDYTIEETAPTNGTSLTSVDGGKNVSNNIVTVTVEAGKKGSDVAATGIGSFVNNINTGDLSIKKETSGTTAADADDEFTFTVVLEAPANVTLATTYVAKKSTESADTTVSVTDNQIGDIKLKADETFTIKGLPAGTRYTVTEASATGYATSIPNNSGTITDTANSTVTVTATNTRETGNIKLIKTLTLTDNGTKPTPAKNYTFTISDGTYYYYMDGTKLQTTKTASEGYITVTSDDTTGETISGLPTGDYTVSEVDPTNIESYTLSSTTYTVDSGTASETKPLVVVSKDKTKTVTTNNIYTPNPGDLELTKKVAGDGADTTKAFAFSIELTAPAGETLAETYAFKKGGETATGITYTISDENRKATITGISLKANDVFTIEDLPAGTRYSITENDYSSEGYSPNVNVEKDPMLGTITGGAKTKEEIEVTNTFSAGDLIVTKTVAGNAGDEDKDFEFSVTLRKSDLSGTRGGYKIGTADDVDSATATPITFTEGASTVTFNLKHGQVAKFINLPVGTEYTVTETVADKDGYETAVVPTGGTITEGTKIVTGAITASGSNTVSYTNTKETESAEATKVWKSGELTITWPEDVKSVEFTVYKTVNGVKSAVITSDLTDNGIDPVGFTNPVEITSNSTKATWSSLPKKYWLAAAEATADTAAVTAGWYDATYTVEETKVTYSDTSKAALETTEAISVAFDPKWNDTDKTIINEIPMVEIPGNKTWVDNKGTHENPKLTLTRKVNGGSSETLKAANATPTVYSEEGTVNLQPEWTNDGKSYTYKNLPKYDPNGNEYTYTVTEDEIESYKSVATAHENDFGSDFVNTELTTFKFSKIWKKSGDTAEQTWPEGVDSIEVTFNREAKAGDTPAGTNSVTYTVTKNSITGSGFEGSTSKLTEAEDGYTYEITDLPKFFVIGEEVVEWKYSISETQVDGYNHPKYFEAGSDTENHGSSVGSGGKIVNDQITVSLPNTGGVGTTPYTVSGLLLLAFTALAYIFKKKRRFIFVPVDGESPWKGGGPLR